MNENTIKDTSLKQIEKQTRSAVEQTILRNSDQKIIYPPTEKIKTLVIDNFPALGRLTALRFLEWAQENEGSVISLPTGKTPEFFIKWVKYFLEEWQSNKVQKTLADYGMDPAKKPDMSSFYFVQIDEFYPILSTQQNSFYYYVNKFYIKGFKLDPEKALLINPDIIGIPENESLQSIWPESCVDLSLRTQYPKTKLEEKQKKVIAMIDQFCHDYETRIYELGGIGFFLGGIGPDGHIGFNVQGSAHLSNTRLTPTNYETQAASAGDLGGIEISRNRLVITIGLQTITYNPDVTAIIFAAGESKAQMVQKAIQSEKSLSVPASVLHGLPNARFYLTHGAAKLLTERRYHALTLQKVISEQNSDRILTDISLSLNKSLLELSQKDVVSDKEGAYMVKQQNGSLETRLNILERQYKKQLLSALQIPKNEIFLHTAPHHDDIMLGYLPYLVRLMREPSNKHFFNYLTSGFTAVTNLYMLRLLNELSEFMKTESYRELSLNGYFDPSNRVFKNEDMLYYLDGIAGKNCEMRRNAESRRLLRNIIEIFEDDSFANLNNRITESINYFATQYPGKKDISYIQQLKGMTREWEADILWGSFGFSVESVIHSRLGFYKGDIFTEEPEKHRDVLPILESLKKIKPTIITVAFDPEGSGPDTHYKVLQAISTALKLYCQETGNDSIKIWGYRNVWYRYHPSESNLLIPVTLNTMTTLHNAFINAFGSQAEASFPSFEYDGPFSELAQKIQVEQYKQMAILLGEDFFYHNSDSRIRSTCGLIYLKEMNLEEFLTYSRELQKATEEL
ncbi:glucosamine-6-phosphate deaminase [candidate division KSB1 bacterium]|nr:glucosamine-6-phosphate deaminase [candidate division KSB1 bacterium]